MSTAVKCADIYIQLNIATTYRYMHVHTHALDKIGSFKGSTRN